jgi:hypothetical protein
MPDRRLAVGFGLLSSFAALAGAQTWTPLVHQPTFAASTPLLLTDGTVMVQAEESSSWWRLTPDNTGSYVNGTWSQLASTSASYAPIYYASAVLPDGRVVVEGGEYNISGDPVWTTLGAIYNPASNTWTPITPPSGWAAIGDAQSVILPNGTFMLANIESGKTALLNASNLTWSLLAGTGKTGGNDEEGWTLLPNGKVLTVDCNNTSSLTNSELFNPATGTWASAGSTIVKLPDLFPDGGGSHEIGPAVLRPDGTVFATGATPNTAIYNSTTGVWTAGPTFPSSLDVADGPAALLPNGNVLVDTSPGIFNFGVQFFEFNGTSLTMVPNPPNAPHEPSYAGRLLVLPTGQILFTDGSFDVEVYTASGTYQTAWRPTIGAFPSSVTAGVTGYSISGTQLNGLSQGGVYGDDAQTATNYPLVRITNSATNHVFYVKTHNHSTMGVATGTAVVSTFFDVPAGIETGASSLQVVANGIPSTAVSIEVVSSPPDFYTMTPCRLVDTRNPIGALGGPALVASAQRTFALAGVCGVPADARAVSLNLTVTQPLAGGDLRMFPGDQTVAPITSAINFATGQTLANNMILAVDASGSIRVQNDAQGTVHLILDINGYFK